MGWRPQGSDFFQLSIFGRVTSSKWAPILLRAAQLHGIQKHGWNSGPRRTKGKTSVKFVRFRILPHAIWPAPGGFTPKKLFQAQHQDISSCLATGVVLQKSIPILHISYISAPYDQDAIYVGPSNKITDWNSMSNRRLHGIWYLLESILDFCVGTNCTRRKVLVLRAHAEGSNFCAVLKLFETRLYPCFLALVMIVPCICIIYNYLSFGGKANTILHSHTTS